VRGNLPKRALTTREFGLLRFRELLPLHEEIDLTSLGEGGTHLHVSARLAAKLGLAKLYIKDETSNPTGAFIDRGVAVEVTAAQGARAQAVVSATTGNLGASLSAYSAKAGIECSLLVPSKSDVGKLYQMLAFGADVEPYVNYEQAMLRASRLARGAWLVAPTNPFLLDGQKTIAFEICEQLHWDPPDHVVAPMGNGGLVSMISKGFHEFAEIGLIGGKETRLATVRLTEAMHGRESAVSELRYHKPAMLERASQAVSQSRGLELSVSEQETFRAASLLARTEGVFAEPAAAAAVAGLEKAVHDGLIDRSDRVVLIITGSGLKNVVLSAGARATKKATRLLGTGMGSARPARLGPTKSRILSLVEKREMYGYEIWLTMRREFNVNVKIPTIYQHLAELEKLVLVRRTRTERVAGNLLRYYYSITNSGRQVHYAIRRLP
jgi:threonine synthase